VRDARENRCASLKFDGHFAGTRARPRPSPVPVACLLHVPCELRVLPPASFKCQREPRRAASRLHVHEADAARLDGGEAHARPDERTLEPSPFTRARALQLSSLSESLGVRFLFFSFPSLPPLSLCLSLSLSLSLYVVFAFERFRSCVTLIISRLAVVSLLPSRFTRVILLHVFLLLLLGAS